MLAVNTRVAPNDNRVNRTRMAGLDEESGLPSTLPAYPLTYSLWAAKLSQVTHCVTRLISLPAPGPTGEAKT